MEDPWRDRAAVAKATLSVTVIEPLTYPVTPRGISHARDVRVSNCPRGLRVW